MRYEEQLPISERHRLRTFARSMRSGMSAAETKLWNAIRNDAFGVRFRRQKPIGAFIADFYAAAAHLVIEVDGDSHAEQAEYDLERTQYFNSRGLRVIRFTNFEVLKNLEGVLARISDTVSAASDFCRASPRPSP